METGGDEHAALAIDDERPVVVAHVEWLEEVGSGHCCVDDQRQ